MTIAVKQKNEDVLGLYRPALSECGYHEFVYPDVYPAGDEYVLVYEITGRRIPPGGIPLQVDCVVDNVETIINVARAARGQSVIEKYVSVCGAVAKPITTMVPVGLSLRECLKLAGGVTVDDPVILTGGVMMGGITDDLSLPISKTIGGVIALPRDHYLVRRKGASKETYTRIGHGQCDQCSLCTELCPRYTMGYPIQPHLVMRTLLMTGEAKHRGSLWADYCCECNICSLIACPEQLDPKNICVDAKKTLRQQGLSRTPDELEMLFTEPHPAQGTRDSDRLAVPTPGPEALRSQGRVRDSGHPARSSFNPAGRSHRTAGSTSREAGPVGSARRIVGQCRRPRIGKPRACEHRRESDGHRRPFYRDHALRQESLRQE